MSVLVWFTKIKKSMIHNPTKLETTHYVSILFSNISIIFYVCEYNIYIFLKV
jgi:hypothetical protein